MIAISNTSPLMALSKIGYIVYLRELFGRVSIPKGVEFEISKKDDEVWHATRELIEQGFVEVKTDFVLLDDLEARVYARSSGLNVIGTLGIIQALLRRGIVKETPKEIYSELKSIDFWITNDLFSKVFV